MKYFVALIVLIALCSCQNTKTSTFDKECNKSELRKVIFDSIQIFVDSNRILNYGSRVYLLEFNEVRDDSLCFILTTIKQDQIPDKFATCPYFYNKDSSLLIVRNGGDLLYENHQVGNELKNLNDINFVKDTVAYIYNPLIWELVLTADGVFLDRYYGAREAEKELIIPKKRFVK
jgi:hypothetical protein